MPRAWPGRASARPGAWPGWGPCARPGPPGRPGWARAGTAAGSGSGPGSPAGPRPGSGTIAATPRTSGDRPTLRKWDRGEGAGQHPEVFLAEVADGAEVGALRADKGQEGEVAFTGQCDLAAGEDADGVGVEQEGGHHARVVGRGTAFLHFIGGVEARQVEMGDDVEQEE